MLTEQQIMNVARLVEDNNGGDAEDYIDSIVATRDEVKDYTSKASSVERDNDYGEGYVLRGYQAAKGTPRLDVYIIDFGDVRGVFSI